MRNTTLKLAAAAAFAATLATGGAMAADAASYPGDTPYFKIQGRQLPLCETEDGTTQDACVWVASEQGNGEGRTYISMNYGATTVYLKDAYY